MPGSGVPLKVPVPLPLSVKVTPEGSAAPPRAIDGAGDPLVVTVKLPEEPTVKVTVSALVIAGASSTVKMTLCAPLDPSTLFAVNVYLVQVPPAPGIRSTAERAGAVPVVYEGHAGWQRAGLDDGRRRLPRCGDREGARRAHAEGHGIGARNRRRLVDGQGEGLHHRRVDAVIRGKGQRIDAASALLGRARERGGAVAVIVNVTPAGSRPEDERTGEPPLVVTSKVPGTPTWNVVLSSLVNSGPPEASCTAAT